MTDNVILSIKQLIETAKTTATKHLKDIKIVYYGDPVIIPQSNMPCFCIIPGRVNNTGRGSRYDNNAGNVKIKLVFNIKDDMGGTQQDKIGFTEKAVKIMEEKTAGKYDPQSIMGILRANPLLPYNGSDSIQNMNSVNIEYNFEGKRETPTYEATMTIDFLGITDR